MVKRQFVHDTREINPHTGLPKHVYYYPTKRSALRGSFQMNGKKYNTPAVYYDDNGVTLEEACDEVVSMLTAIKGELGYDQWLKEEGYLKESRKRSQDEWYATHDGKDDWADLSSMEDVRYTSSGRRITHID